MKFNKKRSVVSEANMGMGSSGKHFIFGIKDNYWLLKASLEIE